MRFIKIFTQIRRWERSSINPNAIIESATSIDPPDKAINEWLIKHNVTLVDARIETRIANDMRNGIMLQGVTAAVIYEAEEPVKEGK